LFLINTWCNLVYITILGKMSYVLTWRGIEYLALKIKGSTMYRTFLNEVYKDIFNKGILQPCTITAHNIAASVSVCMFKFITECTFYSVCNGIEFAILRIHVVRVKTAQTFLERYYKCTNACIIIPQTKICWTYTSPWDNYSRKKQC